MPGVFHSSGFKCPAKTGLPAAFSIGEILIKIVGIADVRPAIGAIVVIAHSHYIRHFAIKEVHSTLGNMPLFRAVMVGYIPWCSTRLILSA